MTDHLSFSQLNLYSQCSRKWYFRYIKHMPMTQTPPALVLGSAVHAAIQEAIRENYHSAMLQHVFPNKWREALNKYQDDDIPANHLELDEVFTQGMRMVTSPEAHHAIDKIRQDDITTIEHFFSFELDGVDVPIIGYIDMLSATGSAWDIKTSARMWSKTRFETDMQSTLYLMALLSTGVLKRSEEGYDFKFLIITKSKRPRWHIETVHRTNEDLIRLTNWIRGVSKMLLNIEHVADPRPEWVCSYCDYWNDCKRGLYLPD